VHSSHINVMPLYVSHLRQPQSNTPIPEEPTVSLTDPPPKTTVNIQSIPLLPLQRRPKSDIVDNLVKNPTLLDQIVTTIAETKFIGDIEANADMLLIKELQQCNIARQPKMTMSPQLVISKMTMSIQMAMPPETTILPQMTMPTQRMPTRRTMQLEPEATTPKYNNASSMTSPTVFSILMSG